MISTPGVARRAFSVLCAIGCFRGGVSVTFVQGDLISSLHGGFPEGLLSAKAKEMIRHVGNVIMNPFVLSPWDQAKALVARMSMEDKIALVHGNTSMEYVGWVPGNSKLNIPELRMQDGPQGFRTRIDGQQGTSTQWPSGMSAAMSWDRSLMQAWGEAMAKEFRGKGANVFLGPAVNLHRVPTGGRNFEYISGEDPFLGYLLVQPLVKGIQNGSVIANVKHFIANEHEGLRTGGALVGSRHATSSEVDERTLLEIYMMPFLGAVEAGVLSVMCGNNLINGEHACESNFTQNTLLKEKFGFKGFILSDWRGAQTTLGAAFGGLDMQTPGCKLPEPSDPSGLTCRHDPQRPNVFGQPLRDAVLNGQIPQKVLDGKVHRIVYAMVKSGIYMHQSQADPSVNVTSQEHRSLARKLARRGMVLLKNDDSLLPLPVHATKEQKILVVGSAASCKPRTAGGGSGAVAPSRVLTVLAALKARLGSHTKITYLSGRHPERVTEMASKVDLAIVVIGDTTEEGHDRTSLQLTDSWLVPLVAAEQKRTVVLVAAPGTFVAPWAAQVPAIMGMWLSGQEQGGAAVDLLFGDDTPAGKLIFTIPNKENETRMQPVDYPGVKLNRTSCTLGFPECFAVKYREKLRIGYRWYNVHGVKPAFPFGHGLAYSTFELNNFSINDRTVTVTVQNSGARRARNVVQLYVTFPESAREPPRMLRDFKPVLLSPNETEDLEFSLPPQSLRIWNSSYHDWEYPVGSFTVEVGFSSEDLRVSGILNVQEQ